MATATELKHQAFQEFQKNFFTSPEKFRNYTRFEIAKHGFVLMNNIAKGFPALSDIIINLKGFNFDGFTSYELLRALQHKLHNPYNQGRLPYYLFYKTFKQEKTVAKKVKKDNREFLEFSPQISKEICSILQYDSKTYQYLKYSDKVQECGRQLIGDIKVK